MTARAWPPAPGRMAALGTPTVLRMPGPPLHCLPVKLVEVDGPLVDGDHYIGRLDYRVGGLPLLQFQFSHSLVGDGCGNYGSANVDAYMGRGLTLLHGVNLSLQNITRANFHGGSFSVNRIGKMGGVPNGLEAGKRVAAP